MQLLMHGKKQVFKQSYLNSLIGISCLTAALVITFKIVDFFGSDSTAITNKIQIVAISIVYLIWCIVRLIYFLRYASKVSEKNRELGLSDEELDNFFLKSPFILDGILFLPGFIVLAFIGTAIEELHEKLVNLKKK